MDFSMTHTSEEVLQKTLDEIGGITESPIGFYHFVEADQKTLSLQMWSTRTLKEFCTAEGKGQHYSIEQAGVWVDCVHQRRPVIHNDYASLPHRKGMPEGHAKIVRELVVPIMRDERIVAILGVGNKPSDYDEKDIELITYLADVAWEIAEHRKAEDSLRKSEERFKAQYQGSSIPTFTWQKQGEDFVLIDYNIAADTATEGNARKFLNKTASEIYSERQDILRDLHKCLEEQVSIKKEIQSKHFMPGRHTVVTYSFVPNDLVLVHVEDITERKRAEDELSRVNRALRMLSETNQALIHITDEAKLLNEACRIVVEVGGYQMAWIGFAKHDEAKTVCPVAYAGSNSGYTESAKVTWADVERGRGPGGTAIRTGHPSISGNIPLDPAFAPWREAAIQRGYKSNIALPLISGGQTLGELAIYSVETDAFDAKEIEILKELADDLAFGIIALRTRVNLDQSELKYRNIFENAVEGIYQSTTEGRFITANAALARMAGYDSPEELIESIKDIGTQFYVHPEDRKRFLKIRDEKGFVFGFEVEFYRKDGSTFWVVVNARVVRNEQGNIIHNEGLIEDITVRKHAEEQLHQTLENLKKAVGTTIQVLGTASEARDPYTAGHQKRVADLARTIATEMGLPHDTIEGIQMAGSIHDIGKLSIPAEILVKPTKLTNIEFSLIKEHPQSGYEMLRNVESPWPLAQIVSQHHERMNGSGYPRNLKGDEILLEARILAVADVVEAMGSHRPYRPTLGIEAALEEIEKNKGVLYDAAVADACLRLFREKGYQLA